MDPLQKLGAIKIALFLFCMAFTYALGSFGKQARHKFNIPLWWCLIFVVPMANFEKLLFVYFALHFCVWLWIKLVAFSVDKLIKGGASRVSTTV